MSKKKINWLTQCPHPGLLLYQELFHLWNLKLQPCFLWSVYLAFLDSLTSPPPRALLPSIYPKGLHFPSYLDLGPFLLLSTSSPAPYLLAGPHRTLLFFHVRVFRPCWTVGKHHTTMSLSSRTGQCDAATWQYFYSLIQHSFPFCSTFLEMFTSLLKLLNAKQLSPLSRWWVPCVEKPSRQ